MASFQRFGLCLAVAFAIACGDAQPGRVPAGGELAEPSTDDDGGAYVDELDGAAGAGADASDDAIEPELDGAAGSGAAGSGPAIDDTVDAGEPDGAEPVTTTTCTASVWYLDGDGDGYGADAGAVTRCNAPGLDWVSEPGDCDDDAADVHPGQTEWFEAPRGDGSYDYDCDGVEAYERPQLGLCPELDPECPPPSQWEPGYICDYIELTVPGTEGWRQDCARHETIHGSRQCAEYHSTTIPACGTRGVWKANAGTCGVAATDLTLMARCR